MDSYWVNKLLDLLMVQTNSENEKLMVLYLDRELGKLKLSYTIDAVGNVLVTKGKAKTYPCVTAHMDTVHSFVDNLKLYTDKDDADVLLAMNGKKRVGIGGDDKCGVFTCLYLLKTVPKIKVVFFSREESGCKGSIGIDKGFFADCRYLIQLDRRGSRDFIQTYWGNKTISHEFSSEIGLIKKKYKYRNCVGTITDVMKLWNNKVGISCINLSCGYYEPHTSDEYISINDLWHSTKFVEEIVNGMKPKRYPSLPPPVTIVKTTSYYTSTKPIIHVQCCKCLTWKNETFLYDWNGKDKICYSCRREIYIQREREFPGEETPNNIKDKDNIILFACFECGKTTDELAKGGSLKYAKDSHMYCDVCMSVLFADNKEPIKCGVCEKEIPKNHYRKIIQGMTVCGMCSVNLDEYSPKECYVCNRVIPKDHKIIERFGVRVCEDCSCPSDNVIEDDKTC